MNRRNFLKTLTAASAVPFLPLPNSPKKILSTIPSLDKYDLIGQQRGIARNLLVYDVFPDPHCYARYPIDRTQLCRILYSHSDTPKELEDIPCHIDSCKGEVLVPTGHHPLYALNKKDAEQKLKRIEDQEFIMLANSITTQKIKISYEKFNHSPIDSICAAFKKIENQDLFVTNIVMHPNAYKQYIKPKLGVTVIDEIPTISDERKKHNQNLMGYLWTSKLNLTSLMPLNKIFLTAEPEYLGVIPVRVPQYYNDFNNTYVSEQGMAVINDKSIVTIEII